MKKLAAALNQTNSGTCGVAFPCSKVFLDVKEISGNDLLGHETDDLRKANGKDHCADIPLKRKWWSYMETDKPEAYASRNEKCCSKESLQNGGINLVSCVERLNNPQESITGTNDSLVREAKKRVGRFLYENGIDFNVVQSRSFQNMIFHNSGVMKDQLPTCKELNGWIFEEAVKEMREYVNEMRNSWAETGCSILLDGWTDAKGQSLINILVDCPRGTIYLRSYDISGYLVDVDAMLSFIDQVINDVGVDNVVQIITYSTSDFMKELGEKLMKKYRRIFWTVSVSCCIDLMLEEMGKMELIRDTLDKAKIIANFTHNQPKVLKILHDYTDGHDLIKPSKIRSALPFVTLENIVSKGESLKRMFLSSNSETSVVTSTMEGEKVAELVGSQSFWSAANIVLKAALPLVQVMERMNENEAQMGYIYETIDQAKETIRKGFKSRISQYMPFWELIDDIWSGYLYSPLHSAGYFLNPSLYYSADAYIDAEVFTGLLCCIVRETENHHIQDMIADKLEDYREAKGAFSIGCTVDARSDILPANWWSKYGGECPELQRLAVRVLNQTCDGASKFQLNRSLVGALLTTRKSEMEQQRLHDMIFLHYNLLLHSFVYDKMVNCK